MTTTKRYLAAFALILGLSTAGISAVVAQSLPPGVLASAQYSADPDLRCDILEVKRVSGGALNIRWRLVHTAGQGAGLTGTTAKPITYSLSWEQLYFIDPAENKKYQYLTDSAGNRILEVFYGSIAPGQQRLNWAKFPAPPAGSTKITIQIPNFAPFDDVPVSQ